VFATVLVDLNTLLILIEICCS